jgi:hypothetical protein
MQVVKFQQDHKNPGDTSSGDAVIEITKTQKDASGGDAVSEITKTQEMH